MPRDPSHPWIGESARIDSRQIISGSPTNLTAAVLRYRHRDSTTATVTAGDSFIAGFYESFVMLPGDEVVAQFALHVTAGSGVLRLSAGTDPDWTLTDPGDATIPLGEHTVSGAGTVTGTLPSFDVDAYLSEAAVTILYVECLSGTVTLEQVKLRLWPPGGPVGGWSPAPAPGFTTLVAPSLGEVAIPTPVTVDLLGYGSAEEAFEDASAALVAAMPGGAGLAPSLTTSAMLTSYVQALVGARGRVDGTQDGTGDGSIEGSLAQQPDPLVVAIGLTPDPGLGEYGLDVAWPPDEVTNDLGVQFTSDPTVAWGTATVTLSQPVPGPDGSGGDATLSIVAVDDTAWDSPSSLSFPLTATLPMPAEGAILALPNARTILFNLTHPVLTVQQQYGGADPLTVDAIWVIGANLSSIFVEVGDSTVTVPAYSYWSPSAVQVHPLRVMQRGDALGMGSGRVLGAGTRQGSTRVFGSL